MLCVAQSFACVTIQFFISLPLSPTHSHTCTQNALYPPLHSRQCGVSSRRVLLAGLAIQASAVLAQALAPTKLILFVATGVSALGSLTFPSVSAIKSLNCDDHEQGTVQGALAGVQSMSGVVGPLVFGSLLSVGQDYNVPQIPYYLGCLLVLLALAAAATLPGGRDTGVAPVADGDDGSGDAASALASVADDAEPVVRTRQPTFVHSSPKASLQTGGGAGYRPLGQH